MTRPENNGAGENQPVEPSAVEQLEAASTPSGDTTQLAEKPAEAPKKKSAFAKVPALVWLWVIAAIVFAGCFGFWAGRNLGGAGSKSESGQIVNLAGATASKGEINAKPKADGTYDASILGPKEGTTLSSAEDLPNVHRRNENDPFALGAVDAPVVISIFSDFDCPFCAKFANETQQPLIDDYVNAGLVRLEWNDLAFGGEPAERAAQAGRAAAAQGKFWEFNKAAFAAAAKKGDGHPAFTNDELFEIAATAGVPDMDKFKTELTDATYEKNVKDAIAYGQSLGVSGTPQFLIGLSQVSGAQPEQNFRDHIELELMKSQRLEDEK